MSPILTILLLSQLGDLDAPSLVQPSLNATTDIPTCGVASVFCILQMLERPASLSDVTDRFSRLRDNVDLSELSFRDVRDVLWEYGVPTTSLQLERQQLASVPTPAILLMKSSRSDVGHFIVLRDITGDIASFVDLTRGAASRFIETSRLAPTWSGYAIVMGNGRSLDDPIVMSWWLPMSTALLTLLAVCVLRSAFSAHRSRMRQRARDSAAALRVFAACALPSCFVGCSYESTSPAHTSSATTPRDDAASHGVSPTSSVPRSSNDDVSARSQQSAVPASRPAHSSDMLHFERSYVDLGVVHGKDIVQHQFTFRVWDRGPVRVIKATTSCCGGKGMSPDLEGHDLAAGSTHSFSLTLRGATGTEQLVTASIVISGQSVPYVVTLRGVLVDTPNVHPSYLVLESAPGASAKGTLLFSCVRGSGLRQLAVDEEKSEIAPFRFLTLKRESVEISSRQEIDPVFSDQVSGVLELTKPVVGGDHDYALTVHWTNGAAPTRVPVKVRVRHPLRPRLPRLSAGLLKPASTWEQRLDFLRHESAPHLTISNATCTDQFIQAQVIDKGTAINVRIVAPDTLGRFESIIRVSYSDPTTPPSEIKVSGVTSE